jgi:regulatory protein
MKISDLKYRQRRIGSEVSVSFDDGSVMALDAELSVRFHLARGLDLSLERLQEIQRADEFLKARSKLIKYLALRKKSSLEARRYLQKAGFSAPAIDEATNVASELGYLDDTDYAEAFARTRQKSGTKGPRRVTAELQARGISRDEAQRVVATMTEPETQMELARKVAAKKYPTIKDEANQAKASRKLAQHLARRGFDPDVCDRVTREFFGDPTVF